MIHAKTKVLLIEDNKEAAHLIEEMIAKAKADEFTVERADCLTAGLGRLEKEQFDVVLLDLFLVDSRDLDTLHKVRRHSPDIPIVVLTGVDDEQTAITALKHGAQDYLVKAHIDPHGLWRGLRYALERKEIEEQLKKANEELERKVKERTAQYLERNEKLMVEIDERTKKEVELQQSLNKLRRVLEETVTALASAIGARDPYTSSHQQRVARLSVEIARKLGLDEEQIIGLYLAALIHDIGKIHIPTEILNKSAQLSELEYNLLKTHPQVGYDILKSIEFPWPIAQIVLEHHERNDGSGYPQGLKRDEIILEAKILCVADVVEAIASHRPYRPSLGVDAAIKELTDKKEVIYEASVVDACIEFLKSKGFDFE